MKKIALILCLVLVASFVLSGCNKRAGTGPHLGRYGVVKEACPGALQEPPGQAIITVKIGNKMY